VSRESRYAVAKPVDATFVAALMPAFAALGTMKDLSAVLAVDRYAAAKALPYRSDLKAKAAPALEAMLSSETEERVALEAAGSAAVLSSELGLNKIETVIWGDGSPEMRMEAVLIQSTCVALDTHLRTLRFHSHSRRIDHIWNFVGGFTRPGFEKLAIWALRNADDAGTMRHSLYGGICAACAYGESELANKLTAELISQWEERMRLEPFDVIFKTDDKVRRDLERLQEAIRNSNRVR